MFDNSLDNRLKVRADPQGFLSYSTARTGKAKTSMASPQISQNDKSDYRSNTDSLPTHKRNTYTKLDLIFEREPKEVQDKLVKLLINYNAVMQYNNEEGIFEVDLLLPFQDQKQKENFVSSFLKGRQSGDRSPERGQEVSAKTLQGHSQGKSEIQNKKAEYLMQNPSKQSERKKKSESSKPEEKNDSKFPEPPPKAKSPAKKGEQLEIEVKPIKSETIAKDLKFKSQSQRTSQLFRASDELERSKERDYQQLRKYNQEMARKQIHIDYELLGNIVERKLDWAITAIKQKRFETSRMNSVSESKHSSIAIEASSIPIANQFQVQHAGFVQSKADWKLKEQKTLNNSRQIRIEEGSDGEQMKKQINSDANEQPQASHDGYSSSQVILEKECEEEGDGEEVQQGHLRMERVIGTSFQDYQRKYNSIKQEKARKKDKSGRRTIESKPLSDGGKTMKVVSNQKRMKAQQAKSIQKDSPMSKQWNESTKVNTQKTHYDAFMRANRMSINRLYEKIKKDIRAVKKLEGGQAEHLDSCNILVEEGEDILSANAGDQGPQTIEGQEREEHSMSDDELRKELMKGYKEKILVLNQDMSSEDLVRYFRFLLSNARRLYTRFLQKKV